MSPIIARWSDAPTRARARRELRSDTLPTGNLLVLSLEAGWTIENPGVVAVDEATIEWTSKKRLGACLSVFEAGTHKPVEQAAATFGFDCTFTGGETMDMSPWVGRGNGEVTFVFDPTGWEGAEGRTIVKAVFRGTTQAEGGETVHWIAEPIEDPTASPASPRCASRRLQAQNQSPPRTGPRHRRGRSVPCQRSRCLPPGPRRPLLRRRPLRTRTPGRVEHHEPHQSPRTRLSQGRRPRPLPPRRRRR